MKNKRSRTGCLTCRKDGYKCDETRPLCGRCVRLKKSCAYGLQLRWQPANAPLSSSTDDANGRCPQAPKRHTQRFRLSSSGSASSTTTNISLQPRSLSPSTLPAADRRLLHHWTTALSHMVSMAPTADSNPYLIHLNPLLVQPGALRSAVLSMSATHLCSSTPQTDPKLVVAAHRHRLDAVSALNQGIETGEPEVSLATILVLRIADRLFITADDSPADHLAGARAIIERAKATGQDLQSPTLKFLLGVFLYQDVLMSVSKGAKPVIDIDKDVLMENLESLSKLTMILRIVGRISCLRSMGDAEREEASLHLSESLNALEDLESRPDVYDDLSRTTEAYRHAAFIYLYRVAFGIGAPHPLTTYHAESCLDMLLHIPVTSPVLSVHIWPLWTAGCESVSLERRQCVRERLGEMYLLRRLPSIERLRGDMEEVWRVKDVERQSTGVDRIDCIKAIRANRRRTADII